MTISRLNPNLARLASAARRLKPLLNEIAFVGGCATGLLVSDPGASPVRPTLDVDAIIEIASYAEFTRLENKLSALGLRRNQASLICRWVADDLILDLMPTDPSILGFSNVWYGPALRSAEIVPVDEHQIRLITAPFFWQQR